VECKICDRREVDAWGGVPKCESHVHVCCFSEIGKEVEACESVFYCVFFGALEDESVVV